MAAGASGLADLARIVAPLQRVDALVLACTHYPAARRWFAAALPDTLLIDPAERLAAAIAERYPQTQKAPSLGTRVFLATGDPEAMRHGAASAWGTEFTAAAVRPGHLQPAGAGGLASDCSQYRVRTRTPHCKLQCELAGRRYGCSIIRGISICV